MREVDVALRSSGGGLRGEVLEELGEGPGAEATGEALTCRQVGEEFAMAAFVVSAP